MLGEARRLREAKERAKKEKPKLAAQKLSSAKKEKTVNSANPKSSYCRYCCRMLPLSKFWVATNIYIDKNGKMSICSACVQDIYDKYMTVYQDVYRTTYLTCRDIDLLYDEAIVEDVISYFENTKNSNLTIMGKYKKLVSTKTREKNIRFRDTELNDNFELATKNKIDKPEQMLAKWGSFKEEDYIFLENKYNEYMETYGADTPAEQDAYKTLALLYLKQRENPSNKDTITAIKEQLKMCGISPEQIKKEKQLKGTKTFGLDIKTYEMTSPIEYIGDWEKEKNRFKDYDGLQGDMAEIQRNIKNFFTGSNDFSSTEISVEDIVEVSDDTE